MKKLRKTLTVFCLALILNLTPFAPYRLIVFSDESLADEECETDDCAGDEEDVPVDDPLDITDYREWNKDIVVDGSLTIEERGTLVIKKGVTVTFKDYSSISVLGKLFVRGTVKNPVVFRKDSGANADYSYDIKIYSGGEANIRNADISGGGSRPFRFEVNLFINSAYADSPEGVVVVQNNAKLEMEGSRVHDNNFGIAVDPQSGKDIRVNRTVFSGNTFGDVLCMSSGGGALPDFRYNWWGHDGNPEKTIDLGDEETLDVNRNIDYSPWLAEEKFHDPVIIIPGILGSQEKDGQWQLDQILHAYDNLYAELSDNGYVPEKDLFTFPYEWRDSNVDNAKLLKAEIARIKKKTNWPKVDLVAHSMGGLLARQYIESADYVDDVDQLITLGTPHLGSPEAYLKWDGDGWFWGLPDIYAKHLLGQEAHEENYADIFDYIHQRPLASLQELLPVYDYLQEVENGNRYKNYSFGYPQNIFLENLNGGKKAALENVEFDKIIGKVEDPDSTISGYRVVKTDMGKMWRHGYPHGFEMPIFSDRGLLNGYGDKTVPLFSAESTDIPEDEKIILDSDHTGLPTEGQKDVLKLLTGKWPEKENRASLIKSLLIITVFSPVDIQIIAPSGDRVGKNFETGGEYAQISRAYYSGHQTKNEFITIPNPQNGEYRILTEGTGTGAYQIEATKASAPKDKSGPAVEAKVAFSGTTTPGKREQLDVVVGSESISDGSDTAKIAASVSAPAESFSKKKDDADDSKSSKKSGKVVATSFGNNQQSIADYFTNPLQNSDAAYFLAPPEEKYCSAEGVAGTENHPQGNLGQSQSIFWKIVGLACGLVLAVVFCL